MIAQKREIVRIATEDAVLDVPPGIVDIHTFRKWVHSVSFPEHGRVWWLDGGVWVDMTTEDIFSHVAVKTEITIVVGGLVRTMDLGMYLTDGVLLSNFAADISGIPDSLFLSHDILGSDRVRFLEGRRGGFTELQGSPDMVLEIVSRSSVKKDTTILKKAYWEAGIQEYWLVDARGDSATLTLFKHAARSYVFTRNIDGWVKSAVFGKSFRLVREASAQYQPKFILEVR
jgi:Putative restriction endonuclease